MKTWILVVGSFISGIGIGGGGAWLYLSKKHAKEIEEIAESIRKSYDKREEANSDKIRVNDLSNYEEEQKITKNEKPDLFNYAHVLHSENYNADPIENTMHSAISPEEFGDEFHTPEYVTLYNDGVCIDEDGDPIANTESVIGSFDFVKSHIGDYEEGIAYIRNNIIKADYEITFVNSAAPTTEG